MPHFYPQHYFYKSYTGNGLTISGNAKPDENGIMTGLKTYRDVLLVSKFPMNNFRSPFYLQVKMKYSGIPSSGTNVCLTSSNSGWNIFTYYGITNNYVCGVSMQTATGSSTVFQRFIIEPDSVSVPVSELLDQWLYQIWTYDGANYRLELRDAKFKLLGAKDIENAKPIPSSSEYLCIGCDRSSNSGSDWVIYNTWDLSESFIKVNDVVVSPWNL